MRHLGTTFAAAAVAAALLAGCTKSGTNQEAEGAQAGSSAQPATSQGPELSDADKQKILASLPAPYNAADLKNGEMKFALCRSCHTITPGGANMTGPNLYGVFGRKAASVESYNYSDVLKTSEIVWDAQHLDQWLANPRTYLPGNKMSFAGLKDAKDRADLIAFLMVETSPKPQ